MLGDVQIAEPELWWPWELGDQPLYRVTVSVEVDGESRIDPLEAPDACARFIEQALKIKP